MRAGLLRLIRSPVPRVPDGMDAPGERLRLHVLGIGEVDGRIVGRRSLAWHGMPGLASHLTVRLPDGRTFEAMQVGTTSPAFRDPRITIRAVPAGA